MLCKLDIGAGLTCCGRSEKFGPSPASHTSVKMQPPTFKNSKSTRHTFQPSFSEPLSEVKLSSYRSKSPDTLHVVTPSLL